MLTTSTSFKINGIDVWEDGPPEEQIGGSTGGTARRKLVCKWEDRWNLYRFLTNGSFTVGGVTVTATLQTYPDNPAMAVSNVELIGTAEGVPFVGPNGMIAYRLAEFGVDYKNVTIGGGNSGDGQISNLGVDFSSEVVTPSKEGLKWDGYGAPHINIGIPYIVTLIHFTRTRRKLASLPIAQILTASQAPVNSSPFEGAPAEYIKFNGGRSVQYIVNSDTVNYDLEMSFTWRSLKWGWEYAPDGQVRKIVKVSDGSPLYDSSDLNNLTPPTQ